MTSTPIKAYLAGPDVFLPDAAEVGRRKRDLCRRYGIDGRFPLDNLVEDPAEDPPALARQIFLANRALMLECDLGIANLSPFRGPGADLGTGFEVGFLCALGKPVFGYSNTALPYADRVRQGAGLAARAATDLDGLTIEDFGLLDNLMIQCGIEFPGGAILTEPDRTGDLAAFDAFERCLRRIVGPAATRPSPVTAPSIR